MKVLIAIMTVALVYVACTRKDETPAPAAQAAPPAEVTAPPADAAAPAAAPAEDHTGHNHAPGEEHK